MKQYRILSGLQFQSEGSHPPQVLQKILLRSSKIFLSCLICLILKERCKQAHVSTTKSDVCFVIMVMELVEQVHTLASNLFLRSL